MLSLFVVVTCDDCTFVSQQEVSVRNLDVMNGYHSRIIGLRRLCNYAVDHKGRNPQCHSGSILLGSQLPPSRFTTILRGALPACETKAIPPKLRYLFL